MTTNSMENGMELHNIIVPVRDLDAAKALYSALLGTPPAMDEPYYVGFDSCTPHLGLDPHGHAAGLTGTTPHWKVADMAASIEALVATGATVESEPRDVGGGNLVARLRDADGNAVGVVQPVR